MKNEILKILISHMDQVIQVWGGHESESEFQPTDAILDLVWAEMAKDGDFHWDTINWDARFAELVLEVAKGVTGADSALQRYVVAQYRNAAEMECYELEPDVWAAFNEVDDGDEYEP